MTIDTLWEFVEECLRLARRYPNDAHRHMLRASGAVQFWVNNNLGQEITAIDKWDVYRTKFYNISKEM